MFSPLKYLYLLPLISAGCLLCACSSGMSDEIDNGKGSEVSFAVLDQSRGSMTTTIDRFAVYGDMKLMGETTSSPLTIFNKTEVVKTDGSWQYQGVRYWFPNHEHSFVAVHPLSVLDAALYADSKLTFTYTLPYSNDDAADIIAATHRRLYQEKDANTTATFHFSHLLSLINFTIGLDENSKENVSSLKIHKLEMSGFGTSAVIDIKPAPRDLNDQTDDSKIDIITTAGNGKLEINFAEPKEVSTDGSIDPLILLPQTFAANNKVQIFLTYSVNDEEEAVEVSAALSDFKWESGKSYNYRIILDVEEKEVNMVISKATIVPWNLVDDHDEVDAR